MLVGIALAFPAGPPTRVSLATSVAMVAYSAGRTRWPIRATAGARRDLVPIVAELVLGVAAVMATGYWASPFIFVLMAPIVMAGFVRGFSYAVPLSLLAATALIIPSWASHEPDLAHLATAGTAEILLVGLVAGYARRLFGEAEQRASQVLSRLSRLNEANALLLQLNHVAQALPASLDLSETLASTIGELRSMIRPDAAAILLWDASLGRWSAGASDGLRLATTMTEVHLPEPVRRVARLGLRDRSAQLIDLTQNGPGLSAAARCAIYVPLVARDTLVGILAVESQVPNGLGSRALTLMGGLAEQAALAIDNAQWFSRLRTLGAEEERTRIARDLHDRVAQSLAYLAFSLDRITAAAQSQQPVTEDLETLRHDVRQVVTEVRDTLYDLRTDVSDSQGLVDTLGGFLDRVRARSGLDVRFEHRGAARLPLRVERELWRIAQEAVTNAEHHARARTLVVVWEVDDRLAALHIIDDGRGFPSGATGRLDSYGLLGMRERADAVGATLEIDSIPGQGTAIHCRLARS